MKHRQGVAVMIAKMHASGYNGNESKKYHGLRIYNRRGFDTDVDKEPLLSWIVTTRRGVRGRPAIIVNHKKYNIQNLTQRLISIPWGV